MSKQTWYEIVMDEQRQKDINNATDTLARDIERANIEFARRWEEIASMKKQLRGARS